MEIEDTREYAGVIYYLHSGDFVPRYIGKTKNLKQRFIQHKKDAKCNTKRPVYDWMNKYGIESIQVCVIAAFLEEDIHMINQAEIYFITQHRDIEDKGLLNIREGGEGGSGWKPSDEQRFKISAAQTGQLNHNFGKAKSDETKAKISAALKGSSRSAESRAKQSLTTKGKAHSTEHSAKVSAALKGRKLSAEHIKNMSASQLGKPSKAMHTRWHINRNTINPECIFCMPREEAT